MNKIPILLLPLGNIQPEE